MCVRKIYALRVCFGYYVVTAFTITTSLMMLSRLWLLQLQSDICLQMCLVFMQDKLGLADCPVTLSNLAEQLVAASKETWHGCAAGFVPTHTFIGFYSKAVEAIESDLVR